MGLVKYLLDTCTFIWLALPQGKLSKRASEIINNPDNALYISDLSAWEISIKYAAGKLPLPDSPRHWLRERMDFYQLNSIPIEYDAVIFSGELPLIHADPFDRLLAAQAITLGLIIISPDTPLSLLGASRQW